MKKTLARGVAVAGLSAALLVPLTAAAEAAVPQRTDTVSAAGHDRASERGGNHHGKKSAHGKKSHHGKKSAHGKKSHHSKKAHHGKKHGYGKKHGHKKKSHYGKHKRYERTYHHGYATYSKGRSYHRGHGAPVRMVQERPNGVVGSLLGVVGALLG